MNINQFTVAQDRVIASLIGININTVISATFIIGSGLAAVAGLMVAAYYGLVNYSIGYMAGIKAFTAAVLGGIGSIPGRNVRRNPARPYRELQRGLHIKRIQRCTRIYHIDYHSIY